MARDGWMGCPASHGLAGGTDKHMDELGPVGSSIPMARGIAHASQKM